MAIPKSVTDHQSFIADLTNRTMKSVLSAWSTVMTADISASWSQQLPYVQARLERAQFNAALAGGLNGIDVLAEGGQWVQPDYFTNPSALVGYSSTGMPLEATLTTPVIYAKQKIERGLPPGLALEQAGLLLAGIVKTQVPDASRISAGLDIATREGVGYTRMVGAGACGRCLVLAGRFYRWNRGFKRHPRCNCAHVQTTAKSTSAASTEGYLTDPYEAFSAMSKEAQDKSFGKSSAQAIRDGADIYQVVNAKIVNAKMGAAGVYTTAGTTSRGYSAALRGRRLTPEAIYERGLSREDTLRLLRDNNYILPAGQVPGGSILGQRTGYGALGRGGTRVGARNAINQATTTGIRNPANRYTMTEAERRVQDARLRYEAVIAGRNPHTRNGEGLTPQIAAKAEKDYRYWLARRGEIYIE